jgi:hypothetical protein
VEKDYMFFIVDFDVEIANAYFLRTYLCAASKHSLGAGFEPRFLLFGAAWRKSHRFLENRTAFSKIARFTQKSHHFLEKSHRFLEKSHGFLEKSPKIALFSRKSHGFLENRTVFLFYTTQHRGDNSACRNSL